MIDFVSRLSAFVAFGIGMTASPLAMAQGVAVELDTNAATFSEICLAAAPTFNDVESEAVRLGFQRDGETFFNDSASINVGPGMGGCQCVTVFYDLNDGFAQVEAIFETVEELGYPVRRLGLNAMGMEDAIVDKGGTSLFLQLMALTAESEVASDTDVSVHAAARLASRQSCPQ